MGDADGPTFLGTAPLGDDAPREGTTPYRTAGRPATARPVRIPSPPPRAIEAAPVPAPAVEPAYRSSGPRIRLGGAAIALLGGGLIYDLWDVSENGGWYGNLEPFLGPILLGMGLFFAIAGRPLDRYGEPPPWYQVIGLGIMSAGAIAGAIIRFAWL